MARIDDLDETRRALLLRIADQELVVHETGLAWSDDTAVTAEEHELLRYLWRDELIYVPDNRNGVVGLSHPRGTRVVHEIRVFGALPETESTT